MKTVIIEDEVIAAHTLQRMLADIRSDFEVVAVLQTVEDSVEWFLTHPMPDLVFMDIHLADGSSFSIFDRTRIECPIIFTTAYNEYALEAFEVNGIDYLLKPISKSRLSQAIGKFGNLNRKGNNGELISRLMETLSEKQNNCKTHFLIPHKDKLVPLAVDDVAYIYSELKIAKVYTFNGQTYTVDSSLDDIMKQVDPQRLFRVNRQYIVAHTAIDDISFWFAGKLSLNLNVPVEEKILVSKARVSDFKKWYTREI